VDLWRITGALLRAPAFRFDALSPAEADARYLMMAILDELPIADIDWSRITPEAVAYAQQCLYAVPTEEDDGSEYPEDWQDNPFVQIVSSRCIMRDLGHMPGISPKRKSGSRFF